MRLRQIALVARDLAKARTDIAAVLGIDYAYVDPAVGKYGLANVVFPVGDTFLEVVSPIAAGTTAGRLLDKRGDGGYMVILQVPDVDASRDRVRACGVRIVDQLDRDGVAMTHLHPKDTGGAILSLDYMQPEQRWEWGGPDWQNHVSTEISLCISAAQVQASDPAAMAKRWASLLGVAVSKEDEVERIALQGSEIRFVAIDDGRKEGLFAIDVVVRDADAVRVVAARRGLVDGDGAIVLAGTRIRLIQTI